MKEPMKVKFGTLFFIPCVLPKLAMREPTKLIGIPTF